MVGLEFVDLPDESRAQIREWISLELCPTGSGEGANSNSDVQQQIPNMLASRESAGIQNAIYPKGNHAPEDQSQKALSGEYTALDIRRERLAKPEDSKNSLAAVSVATEGPPPGSKNNQTSGSRKLYWLLATSALMVFLIVAFSESGKRTRDSAKAEPALDSHMGLKLERAGSDWQLSWNPDVPVISKATKGHLLISDGDFRKFLDLDSSDLRGGTILYTPLTNDVVFRLEVDKADSPTTISESVRISGGLVSALTTPVPRRASNDNQPALIEPSVVPSSRRIEDIVDRSSTPKAKVSGLPAIESGKPVQTNQTNIQPVQEQIAAASSLDAKLQGPVSLDLTSTPPSGPNQLYPLSTQLPIPVPPTKDLVLPPTHLESAQLIYKINPVYPLSAKQAGLSGSVEVHFRIRVDGTVNSVSVIKGNPVLGLAAINAVQAWRYKPAQLNGAAIETDGSAVVDFR